MRGKRPWYVWLSVFGFVYLMLYIQRLLVREDEPWREGLRRCGAFWWRCLYLFAGQVLLPGALAMEAWRRLPLSGGARQAGLVLVWLLVYAVGVAAAMRLERWRREAEG